MYRLDLISGLGGEGFKFPFPALQGGSGSSEYVLNLFARFYLSDFLFLKYLIKGGGKYLPNSAFLLPLFDCSLYTLECRLPLLHMLHFLVPEGEEGYERAETKA